jgi:hypothetical protein
VILKKLLFRICRDREVLDLTPEKAFLLISKGNVEVNDLFKTAVLMLPFHGNRRYASAVRTAPSKNEGLFGQEGPQLFPKSIVSRLPAVASNLARAEEGGASLWQ